MTPQELKNSILQLAIQGKLVPQCPSDGNAEDLYKKIQTEKQRLIAAGKIKKEKPLPEISVEEKISIELPSTWIPLRLGDICQLLDGKQTSGKSMPYLDARYLRGKSGVNIKHSGKFVTRGSYVILVDGENSGEVFRVTEDGYMGSTFKILFIPTSIHLEYVLAFLRFNKEMLRNNKKGAAIPHLNKNIFFNLILPLPPLAEQKRIVEKIEELLPYIDRYEKAWNELEALNKRFPDDLQKSILQLAIQGKLVPQCPADGNAEDLYKKIQTEKQRLIAAGKKEKPLPEISQSEIPFDIPETWKWVRLGEISEINGGFAFKSTKYTSKGIRVIRISDFNEDGFNRTKIVRYPYSECLAPYMLEKRNILLCMTGGTVGKSLFVKEISEPMVVNQRVATIKIKNAYPEYINISILSPFIQHLILESKNSTNDNISMELIRAFLIPLPPLAEQKRIVEKIEELLPLCNHLK